MSVLLYWLGIRVYVFLARIASLFNPKAKLLVQGRKGLLNKIHYELINDQRDKIWVHCASLGEFEQGRPVIESLRKEYPSYAIVLTFFSPSGYEVRKNYEGADYVFYMPFDSSVNAKKFISLVQPSLAIFVKYEFWYFHLKELATQNIPTIIVSAIFRESQPFFKWYGQLHRSMLKAFSHIFVQDQTSVRLLTKFGVDNTTVSGDTRFDRVYDTVKNANTIKALDEFCTEAKVIVAGSTWQDDEVLIKEAFHALPENWKLIIAPHEIHESHINDLQKSFNAVLWSDYKNEDSKSTRVIIINSIGLLSQLYQYADIAYIGGGFNKSGIHNILEAAAYSKVVTHGPNYSKFKEAKDLLAEGGSFVSTKAVDLLQKIEQYNIDLSSYKQACDIAGAYVEKNRGATETILSYIQEKLLDTKL